MTEQEQISIMLICGALHDIAEKSNEHWTKRQVTEIQNKLSKLIGYDEPIVNIER